MEKMIFSIVFFNYQIKTFIVLPFWIFLITSNMKTIENTFLINFIGSKILGLVFNIKLLSHKKIYLMFLVFFALTLFISSTSFPPPPPPPAFSPPLKG